MPKVLEVTSEETKKIVSDERLLSWKGVQSAIDPDARFGWKSATTSFFGYNESITMTEEKTAGPAGRFHDLGTAVFHYVGQSFYALV
ncbi:hypothetical protein VN24_13835 [Paenibacillus beijingensis]|uniref:Uncharacterized protein n=1 Tax=Paenibacillus beijingensis TaxID=1126833 RepID=A0A0D5NJZ4_9BACL|nr:hypothetical protein VN24_13835 [Paenibacillus beijingensis]